MGIFVRAKKPAWQVNQNFSIYTLFLTVKRFFRSLEKVFYKTSQNISAWPNDLFWALKNIIREEADATLGEKKGEEKKKKKKLLQIITSLFSVLKKNCYFCGFWKTSRIYSKEFLHRNSLAIHYSVYFLMFPFLLTTYLLHNSVWQSWNTDAFSLVCSTNLWRDHVYGIFHEHSQFSCYCIVSMTPYRDMLYKYITECIFGYI